MCPAFDLSNEDINIDTNTCKYGLGIAPCFHAGHAQLPVSGRE